MSKQELCFKLSEIPDLSMDKYAYLESDGVGGVLEKHLAFLRQWGHKSLAGDFSLHLYYHYLPERKRGERLTIYLSARGSEKSLQNVSKMMVASPLSPYYSLQPCEFDSPAQAGHEGSEGTMVFGNYRGEPLGWLILAQEGEKALVIAAKSIDIKQFHEVYEWNVDAAWETSSLRQWLNNDFYNEAFSESEQARIQETMVSNFQPDSYIEYNDTNDKVFVLSTDEVNQELDKDKWATSYVWTAEEEKIALEQQDKVWERDSHGRSLEEALEPIHNWVANEQVDWWTRSEYFDSSIRAAVGNGTIFDADFDTFRGVRPALWVELQ
jgi:hypothetical protein